MEDLDELVDGYEQGSLGATHMEDVSDASDDGELLTREHKAVGSSVATKAKKSSSVSDVRSPADIFRVMRSTEEASGPAKPGEVLVDRTGSATAKQPNPSGRDI